MELFSVSRKPRPNGDEEETVSFEDAMAALEDVTAPLEDPAASVPIETVESEPLLEEEFEEPIAQADPLWFIPQQHRAIIEEIEVEPGSDPIRPEVEHDPEYWFSEPCPLTENPVEWEKVLASRRRTPVEMRCLPYFGQIIRERLWRASEETFKAVKDDD